MKRTWEFTQVEITHATIPEDQFNQLLDEWAEIVYRHLCQLTEDQAKGFRNQMPNEAGRTGTNG